MTGWVRIPRDVFEHPLFKRTEMSEREAWLWLIAKAAWKDTRHRVGQTVCEVPRGSLFTTLRELQLAWNWASDTRVRSFLASLAEERMIERKNNAGKTQITICNYSQFQNAERTENAPETYEKRTKEEKKEIDSSLGSPAASEAESRYEVVAAACRAAASAENNPSPALFDTSPIERCLRAGASLDLDVLPTIRKLTAKGHRWTNWAYAAPAIMDARAARMAPAPEGRAPRRSPRPARAPPDYFVELASAELRRLQECDDDEQSEDERAAA